MESPEVRTEVRTNPPIFADVRLYIYEQRNAPRRRQQNVPEDGEPHHRVNFPKRISENLSGDLNDLWQHDRCRRKHFRQQLGRALQPVELIPARKLPAIDGARAIWRSIPSP